MGMDFVKISEMQLVPMHEGSDGVKLGHKG